MSAVPGAILLAAGTEAFDLLSSFVNQWAIYEAGTSTLALDPDSVISLDVRGDSNVSTFPVEQGAFADYNKVQRPLELRLKLACSNHTMSRGDFLTQLDEMKNAPTLYDISTPDVVYHSFTLSHYDYARTSRNGVSMVVADCWFVEVRQSASATYGSSSVPASLNGLSNSPSANDPVDSGFVQPLQPTAQQSSMISNALVGGADLPGARTIGF